MDFSYPHGYFIEHLVNETENHSEITKKLEQSESLICLEQYQLSPITTYLQSKNSESTHRTVAAGY
jgi:hypothetical protein